MVLYTDARNRNISDWMICIHPQTPKQRQAMKINHYLQEKEPQGFIWSTLLIQSWIVKKKIPIKHSFNIWMIHFFSWQIRRLRENQSTSSRTRHQKKTDSRIVCCCTVHPDLVSFREKIFWVLQFVHITLRTQDWFLEELKSVTIGYITCKRLLSQPAYKSAYLILWTIAAVCYSLSRYSP